MMFLNRSDRVTGDAMIFLMNRVMKKMASTNFETFNKWIKAFIVRQATPQHPTKDEMRRLEKGNDEYEDLLKHVVAHRHSL